LFLTTETRKPTGGRDEHQTALEISGISVNV